MILQMWLCSVCHHARAWGNGPYSAELYENYRPILRCEGTCIDKNTPHEYARLTQGSWTDTERYPMLR